MLTLRRLPRLGGHHARVASALFHFPHTQMSSSWRLSFPAFHTASVHLSSPGLDGSEGRKHEVKSSTSNTVKLAFLANAGLTVFKCWVWLRSGSSSMLAETLHSTIDTLNSALLVLGVRHASTAPDRVHQYGYGRAAFFWSLVSALGLFWCGAGVSVFNGKLFCLFPRMHSIYTEERDAKRCRVVLRSCSDISLLFSRLWPRRFCAFAPTRGSGSRPLHLDGACSLSGFRWLCAVSDSQGDESPSGTSTT